MLCWRFSRTRLSLLAGRQNVELSSYYFRISRNQQTRVHNMDGTKYNGTSLTPNKLERVRWESTCTIRYYEPPPPSDVSLAWFNVHDYKSFRKRSKILARLAQEVGADILETYCDESYRGLECILEGEKRELRKNRREFAWAVVLEDQSDRLGELEEGRNPDWKKIALMYGVVSRYALKDAQLSAQNDAMGLASLASPSLNIGVESCELSLSISPEAMTTINKKSAPFNSKAVQPSPLVCVPVARRR